MTVGIYLIQDKITQENLYVGQSKNIEQRWKSHLKRLRGNRHLDSFNEYFKSINKDESRLLFSILEECEDNDSIKNELEIKWFNILSPKCYGKVPSLNNKWQHSEETKKILSDSMNKKYEDINNKLNNNIDFIVDMAFDKSISRTAACKILNIKLSTLKKFLRKNNISWKTTRETIWGKIEDYPVLEWYTKDLLTMDEIASKIGCSKPIVVNYIKKLKEKNEILKDLKQGQSLISLLKDQKNIDKLP